VGKPISVFDSKIAKAILELNLLPAKLDIGKLTYEYGLEEDKYPDAKYFVIDKLKNAKDSEEIQPKDVVLYGRIGRLLARELMSKTGKEVNCAYVPL
jgi:glyceraldehyde 3-phosphate dehydrogenase